ncbi:MAG: DNA-3-methyladenine glycosylase [Nitratireductor sp.]
MRRIDAVDDVMAGLEALCDVDPRLRDVRAVAGEVPLRRVEPGFASLVSIIVSQQVSRASADAIFGRLAALVQPMTPQALAGASDALFREAGLSRPKQKTLRAVAGTFAAGGFDLDAVCRLDVEQAIARMTALHGIGPWTAEVYLLFASGHPDVFPAGDVALQSAVGHAFAIDPRPSARALAAIAESWRPWRGVAARLFWAYYREMKGRDALPPAVKPAFVAR